MADIGGRAVLTNTAGNENLTSNKRRWQKVMVLAQQIGYMVLYSKIAFI